MIPTRKLSCHSLCLVVKPITPERYATLSWKYIQWAVHEYLALAADSHEGSLPLPIYTTTIRLASCLTRTNSVKGGRSAPKYILHLAPSLWDTQTDRTVRERKTCDCKRSTTPNHASPVHSVRIKTNTCVRANEFFSVFKLTSSSPSVTTCACISVPGSVVHPVLQGEVSLGQSTPGAGSALVR